MTTTSKSPTWEYLATRFVLPLSIACILALGGLVFDMAVRLAVIESNRFTNDDGTSLERRVNEYVQGDLSEIKAGIKEMNQKLDSHLINHE
jgi:hypothetical protein